MKLKDFSTLTFDCYGTLIDWESGMIASLRPLLDRASHTLSRDEVLQVHARHESSQQRWTPAMRYSDLLAIVYKRIAEEWGITAVTPAECQAYGSSVANWPAFEDSVDALNYLKGHFKLVILSNVDNASFQGSNERLGVEFDAIFTAEDIGSYKPSDRNFDYLLSTLQGSGIKRESVLHTAESLFHDHAPAKRHALATCWIYRRHAQQGFGATMDPGEKPEVDFQFDSMSQLVAAHRSEV